MMKIRTLAALAAALWGCGGTTVVVEVLPGEAGPLDAPALAPPDASKGDAPPPPPPLEGGTEASALEGSEGGPHDAGALDGDGGDGCAFQTCAALGYTCGPLTSCGVLQDCGTCSSPSSCGADGLGHRCITPPEAGPPLCSPGDPCGFGCCNINDGKCYQGTSNTSCGTSGYASGYCVDCAISTPQPLHCIFQPTGGSWGGYFGCF